MKSVTYAKVPCRLGAFALTSLLVGAVLPACGGDEKRAKQPEVNNDRAFRSGEDDEGGLDVSADVGGLNQAKVRAAFRKAGKKFKKCLMDGYSRIDFLSGDVSFYVGIDGQGKLADAYLEQSTLGDRQTEKCMLDAIREQDWPPAVGGDRGEARHGPIGFYQEEVREPITWTVDDISAALAKIQGNINTCKRQASPNRFTATMYIDTDGSVIAVGMAQSSGGADLAVDCLVGVLRSAKFPSPGSWPAKVTFDL